MRRLFTVLLLLAIAAAAAWLLYDWEKKSATGSDPWRAVPDNSAVIISIPDAWITWDRFTHTSQLWGAFEEIPAFAAAGRIMARTIQRMHDDAALRKALKDSPMLICLLPGQTAKDRFLFIGAPGSEAGTPVTAFSELMDLDAAAKNSLAKGEIIQIRPDTALPALSFCLRDGSWFMATSAEVMDEALLQLERPSALLQDSSFLEVRGTVGGGADAHVLIHLDRAAHIIEKVFTPPLIDGISMPDGWVALDVRARPDAILLSGLLAPENADDLASLRTQGTGRSNVDRVLPSSVTALDIWQLNDPIASFGQLSEIDATKKALLDWIEGSVGLAWAEAMDGTPLQWAIFQTGDISFAATSITSLCDPAIGCEQQEYRGNVLQQLPADLLPQVFGDRYAEFGNAWWTILGDMVLYSPQMEALKISIDAWSEGNSLAIEPRSVAWQQQISSSFGRMLWIDVGRSKQQILGRLNTTWTTDDEHLDHSMDRIGIASVQISPGQHGFFHVVAGIQHAPTEQKGNGTLWTTSIGASVTRSPVVVRNHTNNTNELIVQDEEHKIHLIGSTGKVLWNRQIDGPIMGAIHQIDRFRNGKLQLLFNTKERLYLVDRNGKDVGGYPVRLRENAAVPLAVLDYEKDRDYRIVIPTVEGRILNFGADGTEIKGWEPPVMNAIAASSVHHLRIKNKDYLVLADNNGHVHILDRRGKVRERTALDLGISPAIQRIVPGSDIINSYIIWKDTAAILQRGSFEGPVTRLSTGDKGRSFVIDIDADGKEEIVEIQNDTILVQRAGEILFTRSFGTPVSTIAAHGQINGSATLSVLLADVARISLIDSDGTPIGVPAFEGTVTPVIADLNLDEVPELITVNAKGEIVAYGLDARR